jgi:RNA polymerase sigma-70 factor (ECF subfamily)
MPPPDSQHDRFLSLVQSHQRALLKIGWAYAYSQHDRDDLLQEIITQLWSAFGRYDQSRKFSTWMYRVALNVAIDFRRRKKRWSKESSSLDEANAEPPVASVADREKNEQLRELRELLEGQGDADQALLLLHLEGNTHREIGEILGISESNVGTRLNRLKTTLRRSIEQEPIHTVDAAVSPDIPTRSVSEGQ